MNYQELLPQHALSALMHVMTRIRFRAYKDRQINWFVNRYGVAVSDAIESDVTQFPDFNSFFTRAIHLDKRPLPDDPRSIVSPADGTVAAVGRIENDQLFQAKDKTFSLQALLGESVDGRRSKAYGNGRFTTVYLSPRDYHRVHMPLAGELIETTYIPGRLFSVNFKTQHTIDSLFARNERVVFHFDGEFGPFCLILIGALFVGSIESVCHGPFVRGPSRHTVAKIDANAQRFDRGEEIARFNMGSTVILLLPAELGEWSADLRLNQPIEVRSEIGRLS